MNAAKQIALTVTARTVYRQGPRRRKVYDADGEIDGVEYHVAANTKKEAIEKAVADVEFCKAHPGVSANGFTLAPQRLGEFYLKFPSGGSHVFGADSRAIAIEKLSAEYHDHVEVLAFIDSIKSAQ